MYANKPIPESVLATVRKFEAHPSVLYALEIARKSSAAELGFSIEHDEGGWIIANFPKDDLWMIQSPDGGWSQCYIGQDKYFNEEVLEEKYKLKQILNVYIKTLSKTCPIYI